MKAFLLYVWQAPQNFLGILILLCCKASKRLVTVTPYRDRKLYRIRARGIGVSLGNYIFLDERYGQNDAAHEWGHTRQSLLFGPLYLLIIGIPSAVFNNLWDRLFHRHWSDARRIQWYYARFPERWADRLGDARRGLGGD